MENYLLQLAKSLNATQMSNSSALLIMLIVLLLTQLFKILKMLFHLRSISTCFFALINFVLPQLLNSFELTDPLANREYLIETQSAVTGGFSKWPGNHPGEFQGLQVSWEFVNISLLITGVKVTSVRVQNKVCF